MEPDARALYVISVAAELAGVHPQTLRIYERKGLLAPARTSGRSRRYSEHDIKLLRRIQELTNAGVSLAGVRRILVLEDELRAARERIAALEADLERSARERVEAVEAVHRQYRRDLVPVRSAAIEVMRRSPQEPWVLRRMSDQDVRSRPPSSPSR
jgi:MerR family transcriptional regulator/heat shock protein HspR